MLTPELTPSFGQMGPSCGLRILSLKGFAVVDDANHVCMQRPVHHWLLTSYSAELWALIVAVSVVSSPVEVRSDCQTLVTHVHFMIATGHIDKSWPHLH